MAARGAGRPVTDEEIVVASDEIGAAEGLSVCPDGGAVRAAAKNRRRRQTRTALEDRALQHGDRV